jgi:glucose/arabinose dehydrogenase
MTVIIGDDQPNRLNGTLESDSISGLAADDVMRGSAGADSMDGGIGNDTINGGEGGDSILGGDGNDLIHGFNSNDKVDGSGNIDAHVIASGLDRPIFGTFAPGDSGHLFIAEQHTGKIKILDLATGQTQQFLDIPNRQLAMGNEQGLLGLAFDPDYQTNGHFYVTLTNASGNIVVRRYSVSATDPTQADPSSADRILVIPHPGHANHNGGWIAFGPDGMLYVAVGDGGGSGNPGNTAQDIDSLLGKMLRIDVHDDDFAADPDRDYAIPDDNPFAGAVAGRDEIWAFGLRNPWRDSFDRLTGDLYIADVGQDQWEEINYQAAGIGGGQNYGWKVKEGNAVFNDTVPGNPLPNDPSLIDPVIAYPHQGAPDGGFAVTGGYVYRGPSPGMQGLYFYADYVTDQLWTFKIVGGAAVDVTNRTQQIVSDGGDIDQISSFAEDSQGNLYILQLDGEIHRLSPHAAAGDGADTIDGGAGNDRIYGGAGADIIFGGQGADRLFGGEQNDTISGGRGRDVLRGGIGDDSLSGGASADAFIFGQDGGHDTIGDFADGVDTIRLRSDLGVSDADQALALATESNGDVIFNFVGGEILVVLGTTKAALQDDITVFS